MEGGVEERKKVEENVENSSNCEKKAEEGVSCRRGQMRKRCFRGVSARGTEKMRTCRDDTDEGTRVERSPSHSRDQSAITLASDAAAQNAGLCSDKLKSSFVSASYLISKAIDSMISSDEENGCVKRCTLKLFDNLIEPQSSFKDHKDSINHDKCTSATSVIPTPSNSTFTIIAKTTNTTNNIITSTNYKNTTNTTIITATTTGADATTTTATTTSTNNTTTTNNNNNITTTATTTTAAATTTATTTTTTTTITTTTTTTINITNTSTATTAANTTINTSTATATATTSSSNINNNFDRDNVSIIVSDNRGGVDKGISKTLI